jgi:hypothetical protein
MEDKKITKQRFFGPNIVNTIGTPVINEVFGRNDWIQFGADNAWPQELLRIYQNSSPLHTGLIKKKVDMTAGLGFNPIAGLENFITNEYSKEDLNTIVYKCAFDLVIFGGYYLNVIWDRSGKQIAQLEHIGYEKVRVQKPCAFDYFGNENVTDEVHNYYISKDWLRHRRAENDPKLIAAFNPLLSKECPSQLLSVNTYTPGMEYYSLPDYMSIINWLRCDEQIAIFHLQAIRNNFSPTMIITMRDGAPADEVEAQKEYAQLKSKYTSAINANEFLLVYADSTDTAPIFTPIEMNNTDERYKDLMIQINQEILVGHGATSPVGGIETAGKLGTADEIKDGYKLFQLTKIAQFQAIIERNFNKLAKINGYPTELALLPYSFIADAEQAPVSTGETVTTEMAVESGIDYKSKLKGTVGGVQGILEIKKSVIAGDTDYESALSMLDLIYGFDEEQSRRILGVQK